MKSIVEKLEESKRHLEELAEAYRSALADAEALRVKGDDAMREANRLLEKINKENEKYMELEKQAARQKTPAE